MNTQNLSSKLIVCLAVILHLIYGVLKSEKPFNPDILKKAQITP